MTQSHISCGANYDCSCRELDELTSLARDSGALGSKVSGAGWGGCCVSLVRKENVDEFIQKISSYWTKERPAGE